MNCYEIIIRYTVIVRYRETTVNITEEGNNEYTEVRNLRRMHYTFGHFNPYILQHFSETLVRYLLDVIEK